MMFLRVSILIVNVLALYEGGKGVLQLFGKLPSGNAGFALTGSFSNPGPYGGVLAIMIAILGAYSFGEKNSQRKFDKFLVMISSVSCFVCLVMLPATMSRAAWLSLGLASIVFGFREMNLRQWIFNNKVKSVILAIVMLLSASGFFFLKKDSAIGRFHIWNMELRAIAKKPWTGHGRGTVLGIYGETQAEYFAEKQRPKIISKVAGCPEYAFNEYLKIGVEYGVPAMSGVIAVLGLLISILLRFHSPFAYGLIALCVFSFFSYPLSAINIQSSAEKNWRNVRYLVTLGLYKDAVEDLSPMYDELCENFRYLYDLGYSLHKTGRFQESNEILLQGSKISSDPMFHNIMGKNLEAMGDFDGAEREYLLAHFMVPSRIYPLNLLMDMMIRQGRDSEAVEIGEQVRGMNVNEKVLPMKRMQKECIAKLDSLKKQCVMH